jgi:hypothetical protein
MVPFATKVSILRISLSIALALALSRRPLLRVAVDLAAEVHHQPLVPFFIIDFLFIGARKRTLSVPGCA